MEPILQPAFLDRQFGREWPKGSVVCFASPDFERIFLLDLHDFKDSEEALFKRH